MYLLILLVLTVLFVPTCTAQPSKAKKPCFNGVCVPAQLCVNNTVLSGGEGILDVRFSNDYDNDDDAEDGENRHPHRQHHHYRQSESDADDDDFDADSVLSSTTAFLNPDRNADESKLRYCLASERCCAYAPPTSRPPAAADVRPPKCGIRNYDPRLEMGMATGTASAAGGIRASQFAEFPWTVAILLQRPSSFLPPPPAAAPPSATASPQPTPPPQPSAPAVLRFDFLCGGSLIHPHIVLSAAHCVAAAPDHQLTVRAGEWDTRSAAAATTAERWPHQDRTVQRTVIHPRYDARSVRNDIALLFLAAAVRLDDAAVGGHIACVCLPPPRHVFADGTACLVSGWGKDGFGRAGRFQAIMKRVEVPMWERQRCERALRRTKLGRHFRLDESFVCAGGRRGRDACKGDGGSPLVCPARKGRRTENDEDGEVTEEDEMEGELEEDDADSVENHAGLVMDAAAMLRDGNNGGYGGGVGGGVTTSTATVAGSGGAKAAAAASRRRSQRQPQRRRPAAAAAAQPATPYYQAGIVAWGVGCMEPNVPAAYVNVALFRAWIDREVTLRGWDTAYYTADVV